VEGAFCRWTLNVNASHQPPAPAAVDLRFVRPRKAFRIYLMRSLLAPLTSARWTRFVRHLHGALGVTPPVARVLVKPVRSYVHRAFAPRQRLALLFQHYQWLQSLFARDFVARICAGEIIPVVALQGRRGEAYDIFVAASVVALMQREGELAIYLARGPGGEKLCRISLCFAEVGGELAMIVGATRDMFGLRPKDAAFLAVRAMAQALGIVAVHAVSDANHVLRRLQDKAKHSSYDAYWLERGGVAGGRYGFVFGALEPISASDDRREAAKIAIIEGVDAFVRERRAKP
jgi:uncharacterized protein